MIPDPQASYYSQEYLCKHGCLGYCLHLEMEARRRDAAEQDRKVELFCRRQLAREALADREAFEDYREQLIDFFAYRQMLIARYG